MSEAGSAADNQIRVHVFGRTDVGQVREHNEDNFVVADLTRGRRSLMEEDRHQVVGSHGTVFGVCDGMGGAAAGEVASQLAVDIIYQTLKSETPPPNHDDLARRLVSAIESAGVRIFNEARADRTRRGMGTTATIAALLDSRLFIGQVGDSRAYVLRGDQMIQVTRDQSLVNQLIEAGQLTEEEAETFEHNNIILQALGTAETVQVDLTYVDLCKGDTLLVCSDGLSGMIRADEIREVLVSVPDPLDACRLLTDRANEAGGHDNITVIVARLDGPGLPDPNPAGPALAYAKYALPEMPHSGLSDTAPGTNPSGPPLAISTAPHSSEIEAESRSLKVGMTMVGMPSPLPTSQHEAPAGAAPPPSSSIPSSSPDSYAPQPAPFDDDPVDIPIAGPPPAVVGLIVLGSLLLVAVVGFILMRGGH